MSNSPVTKTIGAAPWLIVLGSGLAMCASQGPLINFTFGVFLKPVSQEFGVGRGIASLALMAATFTTALALPLAGRLTDRFGPRRLAACAAVLVSALLAATARFSHSIWEFAAWFGVLGIVASGITPLPYLKAISAVFDRHRGLAFALALTGVGIGSIVMPMFAQSTMTSFGWRGGYYALAAICLVVTLPILFLLVPRSSRESASSSGDAESAPGLSVALALRTRHFYLLSLSLFLGAGAINGTIAHVVPLLTDRGMDPADAVAALALAGAASIVGRVACGFLVDRYWAPKVALVFFVGIVAGIACLVLWPTPVSARIAVCLLGLGLGVEADLVGFLVTRYLGLKAFGALFGFVFGAFIVASSTAPILMGALYDMTGDYAVCLTIFIGFAIVSAFLLLVLGPYPYPIRRAERAN